MVAMLSLEDARIIERECGLEPGTIAADREKTPAESLYLSIPAMPILALHVDRLPGKTTLVLYEQQMAPEAKGYLKGAELESPIEAQKDAKLMWGALTAARQSGLRATIGEDVAVIFTGWVESDPSRRFSWSIVPNLIRGIFSGAPRPHLLGPRFRDVPPVEEGGESPGQCIESLDVETAILVYSILFQGVSLLKNRDAKGLVDLACNPPS